MGEAALMRGEPALAESWFRNALEKKPGAEPALTGLGRALLAKGEAAEAVPVLEKAVVADAKSARARAALGLARSRAGKAAEGRKDLAAAAKLDPADVEVSRMAVEERLAAGDVPGAGKVAAALSKARKDHPMAAFLAALVDDRAGRFEEAIAGYERALALDPAFLDAHKNLAILCIAQNPLYEDEKRTTKAMEHFQRYADLGGRDQEVLSVFETLKRFVEPREGPK
jgi:tetratricopeptide (TPR) repeat protein